MLQAIPGLYDLTRSEFVRGAVSGLGVLNLGAGIAEIASAWALRRDSDPRALRSDVGSAPHGRL